MPRIGSLFSGYGGLDLGVQAVLGGSVVWHSDNDPGPSKILAHHWPGVPNLGDVASVDFTQVEPVDIITGGFPCQDVSHAGRRAGLIRDGDGRTRSGLWGEMLRAVNEQRPSLVVAENVRGLLSAKADSDMESCSFCMGDGSGSPMRALGAVLADLADIGYDAAWTGLRAADVGAAHGRFRVFILAWPRVADADSDVLRQQRRASSVQEAGTHEGDRLANSRRRGTTTDADDGHGGCLGEKRAGRTKPGGGRATADLALLPTPAVNDMGRAYTPEEWDAWTERMKAAHGNGNGHGASLHVEALRMLPTPRARDHIPESYAAGMRRQTPQLGTLAVAGVKGDIAWGDYAPAIARWEDVLGRPAPAPTEPTGRNGAHRLSPKFVEWMMGLPAGHVTDVPGLSRNAQLKALGNGVVPQQAATAIRHLLHTLARNALQGGNQ